MSTALRGARSFAYLHGMSQSLCSVRLVAMLPHNVFQQARSPLQGRRILVTRAADQAADTVRQLQALGAVPIVCPTIHLVPPVSWQDVDAAIRRLADFDWLILTSVNGVRFFIGRMQELGVNLSALKHCKLCVVGTKTADALAVYGITPDLIPEQFTGEGIVAAFGALDLAGKTVLFPKADGARDLIPQQLRTMGAVVVDPVVYRNVVPDQLPDEARAALEQHRLDAVIFSSPSTVHNLAELVGGVERLTALLDGVVVASIGPITTKACLQIGLQVSVEPEEATLGSLLAALV